MKQTPFALFALVSCVISATSFGCGDDETPGAGEAGRGAGEAASAGEGGTRAGRGGSSGKGGSGQGATSGMSGEGGVGAGGAPALCEALEAWCDPYDLGPGPQHDCAALGREGDEGACEEQEDTCRAACGTADVLPVTLSFAAKVGSEAFDCASTYTGLGADDSTVHPVDFRFYVHDVRLIDDAGDERPVALTQDGLWQYEDVALLDFENRTGGCSNGTVQLNDVVMGSVPFGRYAGVAFKLGVPFELNHTNVATAPSPLNLSAMFWSWNTGRLFLSIMSSVERDGDAPFGTILQLGSTGCTGDAASGGVVSCAKPNRGEYTFPALRPSRDVVVVDMKELLKNSDLKTDRCHSTQAACAPMFEELGIDWDTGAANESQSVFRVE